MTQRYEGSIQGRIDKKIDADPWGINAASAGVEGLPPQADTGSELPARYAEWGVPTDAFELPAADVNGVVDGGEVILPKKNKNDTEKSKPVDPWEAIARAHEQNQTASAESKVGSAAAILSDLEKLKA